MKAKRMKCGWKNTKTDGGNEEAKEKEKQRRRDVFYVFKLNIRSSNVKSVCGPVFIRVYRTVMQPKSPLLHAV